MNIRVFRGQNQIGGSIIEVSTAATRLILDVGSELDEDIPAVPEIDGLFQGVPAYDAVFITHYHGDHIGLLEHILPEIPVFMGQKAFAVHRAAKEYLGRPVKEISHFLHAGEEIVIGDIRVLPLLCDHSAFDSYMLLLECDGKKVLYTGDFRSNGRKNFSALLRKLPEIDILITEGTTLSGSHAVALTERELEERAIQVIAEKSDIPVFVFMAATNIDRLVTMYRVAKRTGRIFLQDVYTASISSAAGGNIPNPLSFSDVRVFLTVPTEKQYAILRSFGRSKIGRAEIAKNRFIMCVRPSMKRYLEKLMDEMSIQSGCLFYSMWDGYMKNNDIAEFLQFMEQKGVSVEQLHTSGHADAEAIDQLIERTKPHYILPVHTENAAWFERYKNSDILYKNSCVL